jgi:hypothetical protein
MDAGDVDNREWALMNFGIWACMSIVPKLDNETRVSQ